MPLTTILIGDSLTETWGLRRAEILARLGVEAQGVSGETTGQISSRVEGVLLRGPQAMAFFGGTNDIAGNGGKYDPTRTLALIEESGVLIGAHAAQLLVCTIPPVRFCHRNPEVDPIFHIAALNAAITRLCRARMEVGRLPPRIG